MNVITVKTEIIHPEDLPEQLLEKITDEPEHFCKQNDFLYLMLNGVILRCPDNSEGQELISSVMRKNRQTENRLLDTRDLYERILNDPFFVPDPSLSAGNGLNNTKYRCVTVFRAYSALEKDLHSLFLSIAPVEKDDIIISTDYQTVAFIKTISDTYTDELAEYTDALIGSMETEGIAGIKAGIGCIVSDIRNLRDSFLDGYRALSLGIRYHPDEHVFIYHKMMLERIVDSIPQNRRKEIRERFFRIGKEGALSEELIETVRVFFQNDLNLTAASRQMFIHRNTLNYRLDKIKKEFGLDLRSFQDAVIFKIISEIPEK